MSFFTVQWKPHLAPLRISQVLSAPAVVCGAMDSNVVEAKTGEVEAETVIHA